MSSLPPPIPSARPVQRAARFVWRWIWLVPVIGVTALVVGQVAWRVSNGGAVRKQTAEARARGEPVTLSEILAAYPAVEDSQNIFEGLAAVWETEDPALWKAFREGASELPSTKTATFPQDLPFLGKAGNLAHTSVLTAPQRSALFAFVESDANRHQRVRAALKRPLFRAPLRLELGLQTPLPHLRAIKSEGLRLRAWSLAHMERDQPREAVQDLADLARLGHALRAEPTLISQLVRIALYDMTLTGMERMLASRTPDLATLDELQQIAASLDVRDGLRHSLLGERAMGVATFEAGSAPDVLRLASRGPEDSADGVESTYQNVKATMGILDLLGLRQADQRLFWETHAELLRRTSLPDCFEPGRLTSVFERVRSEAHGFPPRIFCSLLLPALERALSKFGEIEARRRCALAGLALSRDGSEHPGTAPASIDALGSHLPSGTTLDPFTGDSLKVRNTEAGFILYSVGPNGVDDQAQLDRKVDRRGNRPPYDIGFRVERCGVP